MGQANKVTRIAWAIMSKGVIHLADINANLGIGLAIRLKFSWYSNQLQNMIQIKGSVDSSLKHRILTITIVLILKSWVRASTL